MFCPKPLTPICRTESERKREREKEKNISKPIFTNFWPRYSCWEVDISQGEFSICNYHHPFVVVTFNKVMLSLQKLQQVEKIKEGAQNKKHIVFDD